jgi:hypothetical protein
VPLAVLPHPQEFQEIYHQHELYWVVRLLQGFLAKYALGELDVGHQV